MGWWHWGGDKSGMGTLGTLGALGTLVGWWHWGGDKGGMGMMGTVGTVVGSGIGVEMSGMETVVVW